MPIRGIVNTARSLSYYVRLQEVTANNLANASTDAFKAGRMTANILPGATHAVPVEKTDLQQGSFRETGRPLDLALDGPGFFVVRTEHGERLTRGGSLRLDGTGRLTDAHGAPLVGLEGPLVLNGADVEVQADGTVLVDGEQAGRLRVVDAQDPSTLLKEGLGRYATPGPLVPAAEGTTRVRQGAVEEANLDALRSTVDLVAIQRAYSANINAIKVMDDVLGVVTGQVGRTN
jgi:flagellar basal-body rod protein FlgF